MWRMTAPAGLPMNTYGRFGNDAVTAVAGANILTPQYAYVSHGEV